MKNAEEFFKEQCPLHTPAEVKMFAEFTEQYATIREKETACRAFNDARLTQYNPPREYTFRNFNEWYTKHKEQ